MLFFVFLYYRCEQCEELTQRLEKYEQSSGRQLFDVVKDSEVVYTPTEVNRFGNKYIINFDHTLDGNNELDIFIFDSLVNKEL